MLHLKLCQPHALLSDLLLHAFNFLTFLLLKEGLFLQVELLAWDERHERCLGETSSEAATYGVLWGCSNTV